MAPHMQEQRFREPVCSDLLVSSGISCKTFENWPDFSGVMEGYKTGSRKSLADLACRFVKYFLDVSN